MTRPVTLLALILVSAAGANGQPASRRLTTIDAIRQFPGYYHLQNVLLRGEFADGSVVTPALAPDAPASAATAPGPPSLTLRANDSEIRVVLEQGVSTTRGPVEVRGHVIDVGRLNQDDPRLDPTAANRSRERWPRPGEELFLRVTGMTEAQVSATPTIRALALEPWKYEGQKVSLVGNFRGRNLFGDMPGTPARSRYDFVLRGAEGAIWVTGLRPRGRDFELDVDRRVDSDRWVEVSGTVLRDKGLVMLEGGALSIAKAPEVQAPPAEAEVPAPKLPVEVVFNSPTDGETDVRPNETIRIQFARGLNEKSLAGRTRVTIVGDTGPARVHKAVYDAGSRSVAITLAERPAALSTVKVEILDGVTAFDGAPVTPWAVTFTVGG